MLKIRRKILCQYVLHGIENHIDYWSILDRSSFDPGIEGCSSETQIHIIDSRVQFDALPLLSLRTVFLKPLLILKEKVERSSEKQSNKEEHKVENRLRECVRVCVNN